MSAGLAAAGFDVAGVDAEPQPRYPFPFARADAIAVLAAMDPDTPSVRVAGLPGVFDAVCASPPCHDHMRRLAGPPDGTGWLLGETLARLSRLGVPWVVENVPGSHRAGLRPDLKLCGCMFGLEVAVPGARHGRGILIRERWFHTSWHAFDLRPPCHHTAGAVAVVGHGLTSQSRAALGVRGVPITARRELMGIGWMNRDELAQAIPPAYGEYVGRMLAAELDRRAGRAA
jgi:DNA (cytosine-5)-methyltransferase 1